MKFAPHTDDDVDQMLEAIGLSSVDELFDRIPDTVRLDRALELPDGVSEMEIQADMEALAARNRSTDDLVCFAGAGAYDHYVPAVVWPLAGRSEFYTSYTPYQPELSQGVLQALFEYQSMICELTGLEVSNASLYDGATALAEAVNLARSAGSRSRVLVSAAVDPRYVDTLRTYGRGAGYQPEVFDVVDGRGGEPEVTDDVACVIVQHPNAYGLLEPARELFGAAHAGGARAIQVFDPLSLGVLAPPGDLRADIAVAEGQVLGNHLNLGGPYLGVIATRLDDVRRLPGRIVGETLDVDGRDRLRPDPAGARAAHPAREGDLEHLHEPDADGDRRDRLPRVARAPGAARSSGGSAPRRPPTPRSVSRRFPASSRCSATRRSSRSSRSGCRVPRTRFGTR